MHNIECAYIHWSQQNNYIKKIFILHQMYKFVRNYFISSQKMYLKVLQQVLQSSAVDRCFLAPTPKRLTLNLIAPDPPTWACTAQRRLLLKAKVRYGAAEWTSSWLCGGVLRYRWHCRRTKHLHCDPGALPPWRTRYLGSGFQCCYTWIRSYFWNSLKPKTCHCSQTRIQQSSPFCWYSCMRLLLKRLSRSSPPPGSGVQQIPLPFSPFCCGWDFDMTFMIVFGTEITDAVLISATEQLHHLLMARADVFLKTCTSLCFLKGGIS